MAETQFHFESGAAGQSHSRRIFRARAQRLLAIGADRDAELEREFSFTVAYRLEDGRFVLTDSDGSFWELMDGVRRSQILDAAQQQGDVGESTSAFTKPWHDRVGIEPTDDLVSCILVRATARTLSDRLAAMGARVTQNALDKSVECGVHNAVVFSLPGSTWSEILLNDWIPGLPERLSRELGDVIALGYVDEGEGYELIAGGKTVERFVSGVDGERAPEFTSSLRTVDEMLIEDTDAFCDESMSALGVFVPDVPYGYFFSNNRYADMDQKLGDVVEMNNAGQVLVLPGGEEIRHVPVFARVDFLVLDVLAWKP